VSEQSKISKALALIAQGNTRYAAAKAVGLQPSAVYREIAKIKAKEAGVCPSCGGPVGEDGRHKASKRK
jgi:hypothetical protein